MSNRVEWVMAKHTGIEVFAEHDEIDGYAIPVTEPIGLLLSAGTGGDFMIEGTAQDLIVLSERIRDAAWQAEAANKAREQAKADRKAARAARNRRSRRTEAGK